MPRSSAGRSPSWAAVAVALLGAAVAVALASAGATDARASPSIAWGTGSAAACAPPEVRPGGVGEGRNDPSLFPPTVGGLEAAMLFVDLADARGAEDVRAVYDAFVPGAVEWYRDVSYGRLQLEFTPFLRRLALPGTAAHYRGTGGAGAQAGLRELFSHAVAAADADVDFGGVRAVYVVLPYAAVTTIGGSGVLIFERPLHADGTDIRIFVVVYDGPGANPLFLAHETGHVLGLPDIYVVGWRETFHRWDIMASPMSPRGLFAWHRWKLGWLDPEQIACFTRGRRIEAVLTPLERPGGKKAIIFRRGRYAYVAEVRTPAVTDYDGGTCRGGVLVYRVEFGARSGMPDIELLAAGGDTNLQRVRCGPRASAPFVRGQAREWGLRFEVRARLPDGSFRVRVTRPG